MTDSGSPGWFRRVLARGHLRRRIVYGVALALVLSLTAGVLVAYWDYRKVWTSIKRVTVSDLGKRPPQYNPDAMNVLVFASGSTDGLSRRQQLNWHVGADNGDAVSETIMVVHISPGHHRVTVMNIPRDTVVPVYNCASGPAWSGQQAGPGQTEQIDNSLSYGGPSCLWKTVEHVTGIRLDHFIEMGYIGLVKVVDDIGGVNVCLPFAVHDSFSGLNLPKGQRHIDGVNFLKFWRTREEVGNGSDIQRIQRDDYLLARALGQVLHNGLLSNPAEMVKVITDAASQMTLDTGFTQSDLLHVAESLRGLSAANVQFVEAPTDPYPANPNWVVFAQTQTDALFGAIAHDRTVPRRAGTPRPTSSAPPPAAKPADVDVDILNGSGVPGQAGQVATELSADGFHISGTGDAPTFSYGDSVIEYTSASQLPEVTALQDSLTNVHVQQVAGLPPGRLGLVVGARFDGLRQPATAATSPSPAPSPTQSADPVTNLAKNYGGITGSASCGSDTGSFQGPLSP